jgi:hypothetical protein
MQNIFKPLTKEQRIAGIIFASTHSNSRVETENDTVLTVNKTDRDRKLTIKFLSDNEWFEKMAISKPKFNIIRV